MNKAKVLVLGGLRDDALTDLKNICQVEDIDQKMIVSGCLIILQNMMV